ncbi:MAG: citrate (Si)-synthase [Nitrospinota bacterium]
MAKVLFEITEGHLDTGLRGFPVGTVWTSRVDPEKGVTYVGRPIAELVDREPEEIMYLLLHKELPTPEQRRAFSEELARRSGVPPKVMELLSHLPREAHPMEWFIAGLLYMGMLTKTGDYREDGLNLIARVSEVVAAVFRFREGWGDPIAPKPELGYTENFAHMLGVPDAHPELPRVLRLFHILHYDHGGGNLSTFTGRAVASGLADIYVSMASAMAGLYGPRHGRANQDALNFVEEIGNPDKEYVKSYVERCLREGKLVFGFGHAVLRAEDARATLEYEMGQRYFPDDRNVQICLALREVAPPILKATGRVADPYANVDAVSGSILRASGLKDSDYYSVLFGWSRTVGISAQIIDERLYFRGGRGVAIYRPLYPFREKGGKGKA